MTDDDDLTVSSPMAVRRLADGTLALVPMRRYDVDDPVYASGPPRQLLGGYRDGVWVDVDDLTPVPERDGPDDGLR